MQSLLDIKVRNLEGKEIGLHNYRKRVLLIVNVASSCGFTHQYKELQELYLRFKAQGLEILGFPCNDFGRQEPGSSDEIDNFCKNQYSITFPIFEKITILGDQSHPLYQKLLSENIPVINSSGISSLLFRLLKPLIYLLKAMPSPPLNGVEWNFHKFLINRKGRVVAHFASDINPRNPFLITRIQQEIEKE